ncbi:MAG: hypothetical protein U9P80_02890 [Thermodesulfobacteriota bacterium]|nr:hypothetical protein [Thermodesulfobacteriota bacterium]
MSKLKTTYDYHRNALIDLASEFTICESFASGNTPYMDILPRPEAYGAMVGGFLEDRHALVPGSAVMEIGGGYGSLMKGLLTHRQDLVRKACMTDLSMYLLKRQKQVLSPFSPGVSYIRGNIHDIIPAIRSIDLLILNEVIGDLDTLTDIAAQNPGKEVLKLIETYGLKTPERGKFNLNIGAIKVVEAICRSNMTAFITEHSCDPIIPDDMPYLSRGLQPEGFPRQIRLKGHDEYTIRFSHLVDVAQTYGKRVLTGPLTEVVGLRHKPSLQFVFQARACSTTKQEIAFEVLDHIREYRWMIIF